jgi:HAD superfamily hydrolase (TIGR01490 family)
MVKPLALFDLDFTLIDGDCELIFCDHLYDLGIVDDDFMRRIHKFDDDYAEGHMNYPDFDRTLLSPLAPFSAEESNRLLQDYLPRLRPLFRPWMLDRVAEHRRSGCEVVLATASNSFMAEPISRMLGFDNLICTRVEMKDGKTTGAIIGREAFREGKVQNLKDWLKAHSASLQSSWAYSDSHNDIPMLNLVEHPMVVTPDALMRSHDLANGWTILENPNGHDRS